MKGNSPKMDHTQSIFHQIRERIRDLSEIKIVSIAIFGSVARQEDNADSDIDLLVVAEGIPEKRIQRIPDMVRIKRKLNLEAPLDILLVSKGECQSNFRNHNPLYLDIALDTKIVYDDTGFLRSLIEETRRYIDSNDLRREDDTWSFPVKERVPTELSKITNKEWSLAWLADGKRDLLAASRLLEYALFEKAVYHCQQAVEKGTKAILAAWGRFKKTHLVADILRKECEGRELGGWKEKLIEIAGIGDKIEPHASLSRYPDLTNGILWVPHQEYSADTAKEYLKNAEFVIKTSGEFIKWWFGST